MSVSLFVGAHFKGKFKVIEINDQKITDGILTVPSKMEVNDE